jgi:phosphatidylglycerophosphatase A
VIEKACRWFASCSYVGFLPGPSGTWGSALACILIYFFPVLCNPVVVACFTVAGIFASEKSRGEKKDPGFVVIDEWAGMAVTMIGRPLTVPWLFAGFILFRLFDILKPYPIRKAEQLPGGFGIVIDDVLAGVASNVVLMLAGMVIR